MKTPTVIATAQPEPEKSKKDMRPPTSESANILARMNLSMPKPEFLRSNTDHDSFDNVSTSPSTSTGQSRDPRKRRQSLTRSTSMISSAGFNKSPDVSVSIID